MRRKILRLWMLMESRLPSRLRISLLRMRGAKIGNGVKLGWKSVLECGRIVMGNGCAIGARVRVRVKGGFVLGESVQIGNGTAITAADVNLGDDTTVCRDVNVEGATRFSRLETGRRCYIGDRCFLDVKHGVSLGEEVGIGGSTNIFTHGSWQSQLEGFPIAHGGVSAGDFAWIGAGCLILAGVQIGEFATIGAGTVLRRKVPPYSLAMGNPGKVVLSGGGHMVPVRAEERYQICCEVLKDAADYCEWHGSTTSVNETAQECRVHIDGRVVLLQRTAAPVSDAQAVISVERMSDETILALEAAGCEWFDVARRRCSTAVSPLHGIVRDHFSGRGVRFQPVRRGAVVDTADGKTGRKPDKSPTAA